MGGKGKGKGGPPPPPPAPSGEAAAEVQRRKREQVEREKREALEAIARAKELEARRRDLEARLPALRSHDIAVVPWNAVLLGTHLSGGKGTAGFSGFGGLDSGGGGGVDVVELPGGTAVCVRNGACIVTEVIADALAAALDVRVARMRLVRGDSDEGRAIKEASKLWGPLEIEKEMANVEKRLESMDAETAAKVRAMMNGSAACAVLEFVPGVSLDAAVAALEAPPPGLLAGLGRLCALDLLLNNMDRLPLPCWTSAGNLTNAIVTADGELVGIDQQVNRIEPGPSLDAYLGKVRELSAEVLSGRSPSVSACISAAVRRHHSVELSEASAERVVEAMAAVLRKAALEAQTGGLQGALAAAAARVGEAGFDRPGYATLVDARGIAAEAVTFVQQVVATVVEVAEGR